MITAVESLIFIELRGVCTIDKLLKHGYLYSYSEDRTCTFAIFFALKELWKYFLIQFIVGKMTYCKLFSVGQEKILSVMSEYPMDLVVSEFYSDHLFHRHSS